MPTYSTSRADDVIHLTSEQQLLKCRVIAVWYFLHPRSRWCSIVDSEMSPTPEQFSNLKLKRTLMIWSLPSIWSTRALKCNPSVYKIGYAFESKQLYMPISKIKHCTKINHINIEKLYMLNVTVMALRLIIKIKLFIVTLVWSSKSGTGTDLQNKKIMWIVKINQRVVLYLYHELKAFDIYMLEARSIGSKKGYLKYFVISEKKT